MPIRKRLTSIGVSTEAVRENSPNLCKSHFEHTCRCQRSEIWDRVGVKMQGIGLQ